MKIQTYGKSVPTFDAMIAGLSGHDLPKPTRSTVPLLCYWKEHAVRLPALMSGLGLAADDDTMLSFEHLVASLNPKAMPSHTDLMVITSRAAVAIEGKWTEPLYSTIDKWIAAGKFPESRRKVLAHWVGLIQPFAGHTLSLGTLPEAAIIYQLLHRSASACAAAGNSKKAIVLYQVFTDGLHAPPDYGAMFKPLTDWLQPSDRLRFAVLESRMTPTDAFATLQDRCHGADKKQAAILIREAIARSELFSFTGDAITWF